jgi:hypothetical protein
LLAVTDRVTEFVTELLAVCEGVGQYTGVAA